MALESVTAAETLIQSNEANDDLEDGEIPSDEDDEPTPPPPAPKPVAEPAKPAPKPESPKHKSFDSKFSKSKKQSGSSSGSGSKQERFNKYKNPSEDWAGDVEKAIRAVLEEQVRPKGQENNKSKCKSNRSKNRKRAREEKEEERSKDQKKRKVSDEENGHEDDDEMVFVRGASPVSRRDGHDTTRSPPRRSTDRDNYDNISDNDERPSDRTQRQRDNDNNKRATGGSTGRGAGRRGGKNERGGKNKGRAQQRNDRNGRRNQNQDHGQDPDAICLYYMQGKCHRGDDCPFSHNALPPRKMELCKFYLMDCCAKRDKCLYMHHDFPCKFFHTGLKCVNAENCKFSHQPLNEQVKNILLKHLETAPKEILGDFPRLSREGALLMINNTARNMSQGQDGGNQKIPSLFDVALPAPTNSGDHDDSESRGNGGSATSIGNDGNMTVALQQKRSASSGGKERKPAGKKTRWGSDEDRVPYEQIMLLQSVSQLGLHLPNVALGLAVQQQVQQQLQQHILIQQCLANMEFYNEIHGSPPETPSIKEIKEKGKEKVKEDFTKDVEEDEILAQQTKVQTDTACSMAPKDVDLRQILNANRGTSDLMMTDEAATLSSSKFDDESDRDEETSLVIEMPVDEEDKDKDEVKRKDIAMEPTTDNNKVIKETTEIEEGADPIASKSSKPSLDATSSQSANTDEQDLPPRSMPKKAQELFMRIQQQQREAKDSLAIADDQGEVEDPSRSRENWYSDDEDDAENDDDDDDDDDDEAGNLQIVLKDSQKDESDRGDDVGQNTPDDDKPPSIPDIPGIPQPAAFVDKLGDLSKIDISAEVTKLLSSIKPQNAKSSASRSAADGSQASVDSRSDDHYQSKNASCLSREASTSSPFDSPRHSDDQVAATKSVTRLANAHKPDNGSSSPKSSSSASSAPVSRDPRMSRDPRQRRDDQKPGSSPSRSDAKKESRTLRLETSIYSSGITAMDTGMDTDLRARLDQDHRRKDMDLRQRYPQQDFGDTDLRVVGSNFADSSTSRSDVDLRQMLSLPFKPAPSHVPCTEIDASVSSHPPFAYKVYVVDIPRPDYTGLKLTKNDAQVKYDPRLRKIFRLPKVDIADSPMSPPPAAQSVTKPETPKSPPHSNVRSDPRRKALEASNQSSQNSGQPVVPAGMMPGPGQSQASMGAQVQSVQQQDAMGGMGGMGVQGMPPGMGGMQQMGPNPMMGNMGPMGMMGGPMAPQNMPPMGMGPAMGPGMGNGPPMAPNQMGYDPRFAAQRNGGPGLLGPAPGMGYGPDVGPAGYDGPPGYPGPGNFGNYGPGPGPGPADPGMMGFGPNGPNPGSFGGNVPPAEWSNANQNQNQMRRGGRVRRRNRNRTNTGPNNRGNRTPP